MSRIVWGNAAPAERPQGLRQTRLVVPPPRGDLDTSRPRPLKRARNERDDALPAADDMVMWGPSGGGNRETQGRRWRPFMNGAVQRSAFAATPYSRDYVSAWKEERGLQKQSATTEFDSESLLEGYVNSTCPRSMFQGLVFFLNSCDSDPAVSVYILEKIIRYLGGSTSMAVSASVAYVVAHHLCSAKEMRSEQKSKSTKPKTKWVHPHFILACARAGRLLDDAPYLLTSSASKPIRVAIDVDAFPL